MRKAAVIGIQNSANGQKALEDASEKTVTIFIVLEKKLTRTPKIWMHQKTLNVKDASIHGRIKAA